jgi:hypothetical protein
MLVLATSIAFQLAAGVPAERLGVATLVARARAARVQQDSLLAGYQATVRQRLSSSIGLASGKGLGPIGANRLGARFESVARVAWDHQLGAWGEILAARAVAPVAGIVDAEPEDDDMALVLPYYPGRDRLWPMSELREALHEHDDWIAHPLYAGADSVYEFSIGDSLSIRLPDQRVILLREIQVRPRRPASKLIVGSLWVDSESGHLVRAAYRPSVAMDLWPFFEREVGRGDRDKVRKLGPFTGLVREIIVDHGLYEGRFWLPRTRLASAEGTARIGRVTLSIEQTFRYEQVKAVPPGTVASVIAEEPALDPRTGRVRYGTWRGVQQRRRRCRPSGDSTSARWSLDSLARDDSLTVMTAEGVRFRVLVPCDLETLVNSPLLPPSIYSSGEALFRDTDLAGLRADAEQALSMSRQAKWSPQPPAVFYGVDRDLLRFNRVEGLSAGVMVERELGSGYTTAGTLRLGAADLEPNAEATLRRTNVSSQLQLSAYRRLAAANDWGTPLGTGASLSAALFGRDDGFYYRAMGVELTGAHRPAGDAVRFSWRLSGEQQSTAELETHQSLAHAVRGVEFQPNIIAREGAWFGATGDVRYALGLDPRRTRMSGLMRIEAAAGEGEYGRAMTELTVMQGLGGGAQATVTAASGASLGDLPPQRLWFLGGPQTLHGHPAGAARGDAFWLARLDLTKGRPLIRPVVFADIGWAGPRKAWKEGTPLSAAGGGLAMLDGAVRFDVGRAMESAGRGRWRADLYLELR